MDTSSAFDCGKTWTEMGWEKSHLKLCILWFLHNLKIKSTQKGNIQGKNPFLVTSTGQKKLRFWKF